MKKNLTSINIVLDRSGSMTKLTSETITGFNQFLKDQKAVDGDATLTLATFASDYTLVHDCVPLNDVSELTLDTYRTGGYTALNEAVCKTVDSVGARLAAMPEEERPGKVLVVVITDGQENFSKGFTKANAMERVTHQREKYNWEFVWMGCDISQVAEGVSLGVSTANAVMYSNTSAGVASAYQSISSNTAAYRAGTAQQVNFFDQGTLTPAVKIDVDVKVGK